MAFKAPVRHTATRRPSVQDSEEMKHLRAIEGAVKRCLENNFNVESKSVLAITYDAYVDYCIKKNGISKAPSLFKDTINPYEGNAGPPRRPKRQGDS